MSRICCYCQRAFNRPNKLRRHLASTSCLANIANDRAAELRKRKRGEDNSSWNKGRNVHRTIHRRIHTFIKYLKHNIRRQRGHKGPVLFYPIPTGGRRVLMPESRRRILASILHNAKRCPVRLRKIRLLSASFGATIGWTSKWVAVIGLPPIKWSSFYRARLIFRMMKAWDNGEQLFNTAIQACLGRSMIGCSSRAVALRRARAAASILREIISVASRAMEAIDNLEAFVKVLGEVRGIRWNGYAMSLGLALFANLGGIPRRAAPRILPMARGTARGLAQLGNLQPNLFFANRARAMLCLALVEKVIRDRWGSFGPNVRYPAGITVGVLKEQLCNWSRDGYGEIVHDLDVVRKAASM